MFLVLQLLPNRVTPPENCQVSGMLGYHSMDDEPC